jgi:uncharacterized membrane protein HdeD (DUF308 family)
MTHSSAPASTSSTASTKTKGLISLILGVVAVIVALFVPIVGILAGVVAVVLGFLSRKSEPEAQTLALWGIILGFAGIALGVIMWIVSAMLLAELMSGA